MRQVLARTYFAPACQIASDTANSSILAWKHARMHARTCTINSCEVPPTSASHQTRIRPATENIIRKRGRVKSAGSPQRATVTGGNQLDLAHASAVTTPSEVKRFARPFFSAALLPLPSWPCCLLSPSQYSHINQSDSNYTAATAATAKTTDRKNGMKKPT